MILRLLLLPLAISWAQCSREESPPVGTLRTATHEFVLHSGPEGTLYTVRDATGREVATRFSADELAAKHPELSEDLKSLYGGSKILDSPFRTPDGPSNRFDESNWETRKVEIEEEIDLPPLPDLRKSGD